MAAHFVLVAFQGELMGHRTSGCYSFMPWTRNGVTLAFPVAIECPDGPLASLVHAALQPLAQQWLQRPRFLPFIEVLDNDNAFHDVCRQMDHTSPRYYVVQHGNRAGVFVTRTAAVQSLELGGQYRDLRILPTFRDAMVSMFTNGDYPAGAMSNVQSMEAAEAAFALLHPPLPAAPSPAPVAPLPNLLSPDPAIALTSASSPSVSSTPKRRDSRQGMFIVCFDATEHS
ncbi:hypothetical protein C8J56DRAFT_1059877 [Mycena floridula]|nr:hypothetical protein C8J56DRAFT_1059877 [Mycena floridula]